MAKLRRFLLWATLGLLVALTVFSIYGAFIGANRAKTFFNTLPLGVYWIALLVSLIAGMLSFKRLLRVPSSLLVHAGCVVILLGGLWGSATGRELQQRWLGRDIIPPGYIILMNGQQDNQIHLNSDPNRIQTLSFDLALDEFRMEFYPGKLYVIDSYQQKQWAFPAEPNAVYDLGPPHGTIQISQAFKNFKIRSEEVTKIEDGNSVTTTIYKAYDDPRPGENPALEVLVSGETKPRRVFALRAGHAQPGSTLTFQYRPGMVSDYISELKVMKDGEVVAQKDVEVNHPLYYGGYHFYQSSYGSDPRTGQAYTVLSVTPITGLAVVFLGYLLMCVGVTWQCWFISISKTLKTWKQEVP